MTKNKALYWKFALQCAVCLFGAGYLANLSEHNDATVARVLGFALVPCFALLAIECGYRSWIVPKPAGKPKEDRQEPPS